MSKKNSLTPETAERVLLADIANILRKAKSGKPLTKYERDMIEKSKQMNAAPRSSAKTPDESQIEARKGRGGNQKFSQVRWTIEVAAAEFDINPRTLSKRLKSVSTEPGRDGRFSTKQICDAVFTDYEAARSRKEAALARMAEREDRKQDGELIEAEKVRRAWEHVGAQIKQRVQLIPSKLQSRLSLTQFQKQAAEQECDDALSELAKGISYDETETEGEEQ